MPAREGLVQGARDAGQAHAAAMVALQVAMWGKLGLSAADGRAWDLLLRRGPLLAGEIGHAMALTSGSVTALVDRLEAGGYVQRIRNAGDRRRVLVHADPQALAALAPLMAGFWRDVNALGEGLDDAALAAMTGYLRKVTALAEKAIETLES